MSESKGLRIPYWLLKLLPMWDHICPKCRKEVKQKSNKCIHCGENYGTPVRVPPRMLNDPKALEEYVHKHVFPRVSPLHRAYLTQFFTVLFSDGFEPPETNLFENWDTVAGAPVIVGTNPHHGTKNAEFDANGEYVEKNIVSSPNVYVRVYVRISALPGNLQYARIFRFWESATGNTYGYVSFRNLFGTQEFEFALNNNTGAQEFFTSVTIPVANQYYCVEVGVERNTLNGSKGWIDGTLEATLAGTSRNGNIDRVIVGTEVLEYAATESIDCVVVADARINCEGAVAPKGTIAVHAKLAGII